MGIFSFFKKKDIKKLNPESKWLVEIIGDEIRTVNYEGLEIKFKLNDISQIVIETNDSGPLGTDIWWRVKGKKGLLSVPGGATGESEMLVNFQKFSRFNNEEFIKAMGSTENAEFICWRNEYLN